MTQIKIDMHYKKSTKNTHVYESTSDISPVPTLYINKSAFDNKPQTIEITIEAKG